MIRYLGADVGGTYVRVGAMEEDGRIVSQRRASTLEGVSDGGDLIRKLEALLRGIPDWERAETIGVGVPGAVSPRTGRVTEADNLTLLNDLPLAQELSARLEKPVVMENDARVAALAEAVSGAGRGRETVCYVTISTGLGGATVQSGRIYRGSSNLGSYLCRMILDGGRDCERLISGTALRRQLSEALGRPVNTAGELFARAAAGDPAALALEEAFIRNLASLFLNLAVTFNPDVIVAGGGVMQSADRFWEPVGERFRALVHPQARETVLAKAQHREPGLLGACLLAARGA